MRAPVSRARVREAMLKENGIRGSLSFMGARGPMTPGATRRSGEHVPATSPGGNEKGG
jgi:hypothetical protein